jgi:hypothetical protein
MKILANNECNYQMDNNYQKFPIVLMVNWSTINMFGYIRPRFEYG